MEEQIQKLQQQNKTTTTPSFDILSSLPFWITDKDEHRQKYQTSIFNNKKGFCCFSHAIGLPYKGGKKQPWWPYQEIFLEAKKTHKYIRVIKATGLGMSEIELYWMAHMAFKHAGIPNSKPAQMVIICGPNIDIAQQLIARLITILTSRMPELLEDIDKTKTTVQIGNVEIKAFPSNHIDSVRALPNPIYILLDEGDFFNVAPDDPNNVVKVVERYIAKSDPYIILVSTPNLPGGLFDTMDRDPNSRYYTLRFNYEWGLGKIYDYDQIENAKKSSSFEREYNLKYGYGIGNIFEESWISLALERGTRLKETPVSTNTSKSIGCDPAWGSSKFGLTMIEHIKYSSDESLNNSKRVVFSKEYDKALYSEMIDIVYDYIKQYNVNFVFIDGSQVDFIRSLKAKIGEDTNYEAVVERARKYNTPLHNYMSVIPVLNQQEGKSLIDNVKYFMSVSKTVAIDEENCMPLVQQMRFARQKEDGKLDKTSEISKSAGTLDSLESFFYAMKYFEHI